MPHSSWFLSTVSACALGALFATSSLAQTAQPSPRPEAMASSQKTDSDMQKVLSALEKLGPKPLNTLSAEEARKQPSPADAVMAVLNQEGKAADMSGVTTTNMTYTSPGGAQPIRVYKPDNAGQGPLPVIVYYHGGGWVIANLDTYEASARALAKKTGAIVASVEYRHAPEHKFPAAHEDAFAAYRWVLDNAQQMGGDRAKVALAGESAGGNLAANVAIMARDQNVQAPVHMVLVYPVAGTDMNTASYRENENAKPLNKAMMEWFFTQTLNPQDRQSPMINLVSANLQKLPGATVITAQIDPLRTEGEQLAQRLQSAGVPVVYRNYDGVAHEFFGMNAVVADAEQAQNLAAENLKRAFSEQTTGSTGSAETER